MVGDLFNEKVVFTGVGTFSGLVLGIMLDAPMKSFLGDYGKEGSAVSLVIGGSLLMGSGQSELKSIGLGVGATGMAILGRSLFDRLTGQTFFDVKKSGSNGNGENGEDEPPMPDEGTVTTFQTI